MLALWLVLCAPIAVETQPATISWAIDAADSNRSVSLYREAARTWAASLDDERVIVFSGLLSGTIPGTGKRVVPCCDGRDLTQSIEDAQQKREHTWAKMLALFPRSDWYVSTEDDVWWNVTGLQTLLAPLSTSKPRLVGMGPGHSVYGPYVIVNRPLLELFANASLLSACRDEIIRQNPWTTYTCASLPMDDCLLAATL
jgi:hypothetical protein